MQPGGAVGPLGRIGSKVNVVASAALAALGFVAGALADEPIATAGGWICSAMCIFVFTPIAIWTIVRDRAPRGKTNRLVRLVASAAPPAGGSLEGSATNAGAQVGHDDPRHVRRPVR
jgi:hypothetical protein